MKNGIVISTADIETAIHNGDVKSLVRHLEECIVKVALVKSRGNMALAARNCNMNRGTLTTIHKRSSNARR